MWRELVQQMRGLCWGEGEFVGVDHMVELVEVVVSELWSGHIRDMPRIVRFVGALEHVVVVKLGEVGDGVEGEGVLAIVVEVVVGVVGEFALVVVVMVSVLLVLLVVAGLTCGRARHRPYRVQIVRLLLITLGVFLNLFYFNPSLTTFYTSQGQHVVKPSLSPITTPHKSKIFLGRP